MHAHTYLAISVLIIKCTCTCCNIGLHPLSTSSTRPWCKSIFCQLWEGIAGTLKACDFSILSLWPMESAVQYFINFQQWSTWPSCGSKWGRESNIHSPTLFVLYGTSERNQKMYLYQVLALCMCSLWAGDNCSNAKETTQFRREATWEKGPTPSPEPVTYAVTL